MRTKEEQLIDLIYEKLQKIKSNKLDLSKNEFRGFVFFLINNS